METASATSSDALLPCRTQIVLGDFQEDLNPPRRSWDITFIGFSYHHLIGPEKLAFAQRPRAAHGEGGEWTFFEPLLCEDQTRADYLKQGLSRTIGKGSTQRRRPRFGIMLSTLTIRRVCESFTEIALQAGFRAFEHLYTDPFRFYGAFRALA